MTRATIHPLATRRPVQPFDRDAISRRNRHAFAAGDQCRRVELAERLRELAAALLNDEVSTITEHRAMEAVRLFVRERT